MCMSIFWSSGPMVLFRGFRLEELAHLFLERVCAYFLQPFALQTVPIHFCCGYHPQASWFYSSHVYQKYMYDMSVWSCKLNSLLCTCTFLELLIRYRFFCLASPATKSHTYTLISGTRGDTSLDVQAHSLYKKSCKPSEYWQAKGTLFKSEQTKYI